MSRVLIIIGDAKYLQPLQLFSQENIHSYTLLDTQSLAGCAELSPLLVRTLEQSAYDLIVSDYALNSSTVCDYIALFNGIPLLVMGEKERCADMSGLVEGYAVSHIIKDPELYFLKLLPAAINQAIKYKPEYESILQELPDIVYKINPEGYFTFINEAVKNLGYKPEELIGKHFKAIVHPEDYFKVSREEILKRTIDKENNDRNRIKLFDERRKRHRKITSFEIRIIPKLWNAASSPVIFGSLTIFAEVNARGHYENAAENPNFLGTVGIIRNITHQKKSQALILKLYKVMHQSPVSILITDKDGKIEYVNPYFLSVSGYKHNQIINQDIDLLKIGKSKPGTLNSYMDIIRNTHNWQGEVLSSRKEGETYWESVFVNAINNAEGVISNYLIIKIDINELKSAQEVLKTINDELDKRVSRRTFELEKANRELQLEMEERKKAEEEQRKLEGQLFQAQKIETLGTLAGGIAHDFNNILTPILGFANLVLLELGETHKCSHDLMEIISATKHARELVQQILTFASVVEPNRTPIEIFALVQETLNLVRASLPSTIEIQINNALGKGYILANHSQIHQVMMNLCANAAYAMKGTRGILRIHLGKISTDEPLQISNTTLEQGKYICLDISDTGHGIDKEIINKIFDPFFTTKDKSEGTGLGLSVVHGIISSHGGKIIVSSHPGNGTTFSLYFPAYEGSVTDHAPTRSIQKRGTERILLVDDEERVAVTLEKMLKALGYTVARFTDSYLALQEFKSRPGMFDLVVTDYTMPHLTGLELSRALQEIDPAVPVILTTGYGEGVCSDEQTPTGISAVLMKPFSVDELSNMVRKVLDEK